ncbi:MAG TPA: amidase family protein, partial [Candidatus Dormibacteraeota bacterium]|nr:amidase family protein [Candidatus Dormibacteraeota bacterium]
MAKTRREFLGTAAAGVAAIATGSLPSVAEAEPQTPSTQSPAPNSPPSNTVPAGAPPSLGSGPGAGPQVSVQTFTEAEKLVQVELQTDEIDQAAASWRGNLAALYERRTGPKKVEIPATTAPYSTWNPVLPQQTAGPKRDRFVRSNAEPGPLPANEDDIAFAPVTQLSRWIETRKITSERLSQIYLQRLEKFGAKLRCVITLTRDLAMAQAKQADAEIAAGKYRGPLHGIPWGAKDLLDTAGIPTTYGAEPFRDRIPKADAAVVKRLHEAGAVLVAKLSLGALALNDIWF